MWNNFTTRLSAAQQTTDASLALFINPIFDQLPLPITRFDDPFFPFGKEVIKATRDIVSIYVFDFASYLAMGAAGVVALERTIRYVGRERISVLHGAFTGRSYSPMADKTGLGVDAITLTDASDLQHYIQHPPYAALVTQSGAVDLDNIPQQGGIYFEDADTITLRLNGRIHNFTLAKDDVLYAGKLDDYPQQIRTALEAYT